MRSPRLGCLPIFEDQYLVGIVTEADLLYIVEELPDVARPRSLPPLRVHLSRCLLGLSRWHCPGCYSKNGGTGAVRARP